MKNSKLAVLLMVVALSGFSACKSTEMAQDAAMPAPQPEEEMADAPAVQAQPAANATTNDAGVDVADLIAKHLEARGGKDNIKAVQSIKMSGTVNAMGMDIDITNYIKRPNKLRSIILVKSMNMEMNQGFDGEMGWMQQPGQDPQPMPKSMTRSIKDQANIDGSFMDYEERGYTVEYLGEDLVNDKPAYKVKLIRPDHPESVVYLDKDSYLEVKIDAEGVNPQSGQPVQTESFISDYRTIDGIQMAHSIEVKMGGNTAQTIKFETIEVNPEVDDELFRMPVELPDVN